MSGELTRSDLHPRDNPVAVEGSEKELVAGLPFLHVACPRCGRDFGCYDTGKPEHCICGNWIIATKKAA